MSHLAVSRQSVCIPTCDFGLERRKFTAELCALERPHLGKGGNNVYYRFSVLCSVRFSVTYTFCDSRKLILLTPDSGHTEASMSDIGQ